VVQEQLHGAEDIPFPHLPIEPMIDDEKDEIPLNMLLDGPDPEQEEDQLVENADNLVLNVGAVLVREEQLPNPFLL
jgi:hypothetical protein